MNRFKNSFFYGSVSKQIVLAILVFCMSGLLIAQAPPTENVGRQDPKEIYKKIGIDQKLGNQIPLDIPFTDENGKKILLGDYFKQKPIVLIPLFYTCSSACIVTQEETMKSFVKMNKKKFVIGQNYDVVEFSINPKEDHEIASIKKAQMLKGYKDELAGAHWHFLTGSYDSIKKLTDAIGFRFTYDKKTDQIQHAAGIMVLTPKGRISRYFYGTQFESKLLRDSLIDAGTGQVGSKSEVVLFGCLHIDPLIKSLSTNIFGWLKILATVTIVFILGGIFLLSRKTKPKEDQYILNKR